MTWYIALVAILNLALGYTVALYLRGCRSEMALSSGETVDNSGDWEN